MQPVVLPIRKESDRQPNIVRIPVRDSGMNRISPSSFTTSDFFSSLGVRLSVFMFSFFSFERAAVEEKGSV